MTLNLSETIDLQTIPPISPLKNFNMFYKWPLVFESAFTNQTPPPSSNIYQYIIIIALLLFIIFRRFRSGINGRVYSEARILRQPVLYAIFLAYFIAVLYSYVYYDMVSVIMILPGFLIGDRVGSLSTVYWQDKTLMYKRSTLILALTTSLFLIRFVLEFALNTTNVILLAIVNVCFALSLGVLIGEYFHLKSSAMKLRGDQPAEMGANNA